MFYTMYLTALCRRRVWAEPLFETEHITEGWWCRVCVNDHAYYCHGIFSTEELARENAAAAAYVVCRNFSVNDGIGSTSVGIKVGLPVAIGTARRRSANSGMARNFSTTSETSSFALSDHSSISGVSTMSSNTSWSGDSIRKSHRIITERTPSLTNLDRRRKRPEKTSQKYTCVICKAEFSAQNDWQEHEKWHEEQIQYSCPDCHQPFFDDTPSLAYHRTVHGCEVCGHELKKSKTIGLHKERIAWGCGFCAESLGDWHSRCDHVATHYEDGVPSDKWAHQNVIIGLLRQPEVYYVWHSLLRRRHRASILPDDLKFHWDERSTGRKSIGTFQLQDLLELKGERRQIANLVQLAYNLGCDGLVSKPPSFAPPDVEKKASESPFATRLQLGEGKKVKPIRMRVRHVCHICQSTFGVARECNKCQHTRCSSCVRRPPVKNHGNNEDKEHSFPTNSDWNLDKEETERRVKKFKPRDRSSVMKVYHCEKEDKATLSSTMSSESDATDLGSTFSNLSIESTTSEMPNSTDQDETLTFVLEPWRLEMVDRLMLHFRTLFDQRLILSERGSNDESSHSQENGPNGGTSSQEVPTLRRKRKQQDLKGEDGEGAESEDGDNDARKGPKIGASNTDEPKRKLACPYYKRNPSKHQKYRSCAGPGWDTTHRLKEHLYRRHILPIRCSRCCTIFGSDVELTNHYRQPEICEMVILDLVEGFDKDQEKKMRSRKKSAATTEREKWIELYNILFPDDDEDLTPSPYHEVLQTSDQLRLHEFARYEQYTRRELPSLVRRRLELRVRMTSSALEEQLRGELVDIVRDCQTQLSRSYQQTHLIPMTSTAEGIDSSLPTAPSCLLENNSTALDPPIDLSPYLAPSPLQVPDRDQYSTFWGQVIPSANMDAVSDSGYVSSLQRYSTNPNQPPSDTEAHPVQATRPDFPVDSSEPNTGELDPLFLPSLDGWVFDPEATSDFQSLGNDIGIQ